MIGRGRPRRLPRRGWYLVLAAIAALEVAFSAGRAAPAAPGPVAQASALTAESRRGQHIYQLQCAACHGLAGDRVASANLLNGDKLRALGDAGIAAATSQGTGRMLGLGEAEGGPMTTEDVSAVVAYVKVLARLELHGALEPPG